MPLGSPDVVPMLTDDVVTLRAMTDDDLPAVVEQSQDPDTVRWTTVPTPYGPEDAAAYFDLVRQGWQDGSRSTWVVEHDGDFAGLVGHRPRGAGRVEISFAAHSKHRGQGLMTRAVRLVCEQAFSTGAEVVLWHAHVGNFGSRRVVWRNGFRIGGSLRRTHEQRGALVDAWAGSLVKGDPMEPVHPWRVPPTLEGDGVRLRAFRSTDAFEMPEALDEIAAQFITRAMPTRETFGEWLLTRTSRSADGETVMWAVSDPATDVVLGGLQVFRLGSPLTVGSGMVGYWLLESARGRGVMAKALDAATECSFSPVERGGLGLHRLEAGCASDNLASVRVLRRAGFHQIGTEREAMALAGGRHGSSVLFDLLATDDRAERRVESLTIPVLETEHLRLRPWRDTDVPGPGEGPDDASLRFMPANVHPDTEAFPAWLRLKRAQMAEGDNLNWCVADKGTDHCIGNVTIFRMGPAAGRFRGELGYWLHPSGRGRGAVAEALDQVIGHAFTATDRGGLGLTRIHAGTDLDNTASQSVLRRVGFRQWGTDRQAYRRSSGELTDGRTRHWLSTLPSPYTDEDAATYLSLCRAHASSGTGLFLAMADPADDRCIGSIAVMNLQGDDRTLGEIGYWTHPDARGRGAMTEAVHRIVRHAFAPVDGGGLGLRRLVLRAAAGNDASQHVAQANGFVRTGVQRHAERLGDGSFDDLVDYDLLATQWPGR